jgi:CubicO group peptidase (beta-lactamase class C family)
VSTPEPLAAKLAQLVRHEQRDKRLPSIAAAVVRDGELVWETAVGAANVTEDPDATTDTQYRIGSIKKTFTAAAIMQLRDAGKLDLEDTLDRHIEGAVHRPTLRRLLSHARPPTAGAPCPARSRARRCGSSATRRAGSGG